LAGASSAVHPQRPEVASGSDTGIIIPLEYRE
jgi:hypothetical protein